MPAFKKKDPGKFTVRFNMADPQQRAVIDLLNQQGRYKSQFLTSAILHYVHCPEIPGLRSAAVDSTEIERTVRHILAQQQTAASPALQRSSQGPDCLPLETRSLANEAEKTAILKTLDAFRQR